MKAEEMLKDLEEDHDYKMHNISDGENDEDIFKEVLKFWGGEPSEHKLRCSDGTERTFSFDE